MVWFLWQQPASRSAHGYSPGLTVPCAACVFLEGSVTGHTKEGRAAEREQGGLEGQRTQMCRKAGIISAAAHGTIWLS